MARKSTIGTNPLDKKPIDNVIPPTPAAKAKASGKRDAKKPAPPQEERERLTIQIPLSVVERARNAAYWDRVPLAQLVEEGLRMVVDKLERARGEAFPEREQALRAGRPFKRR